MATVHKLKWIGYVDYGTAVCQMMVGLACTVVALYYYFGENKGGNEMKFFAPTLNLSITAIVLFVNRGQMLCAKSLIRPKTDYLCVAEMERIRQYWYTWNKATLLVDLFWFPYFTLATYMKRSHPLAIILICFVVTIIIRLGISCAMVTLKMEPVPVPVVNVVPPNDTEEIEKVN